MPEKEFAFLIVVLTGKINIPALDYIAYILSAYALIICVTAILKIINFVRNGVSEHPFMKWLLSVPIVEKFIHEKKFPPLMRAVISTLPMPQLLSLVIAIARTLRLI